MPNGKNVNVYVVTTDKGCVVRPAHAIVDRGDTLTWHNLLGDAVTLLVPDARIYGGAVTQPIPAGAKWASPAVLPACPRNFYAYGVYCHAAGLFAEGESHPGMIVG